MAILDEISQQLQEGKAKVVKQLVATAIEEGLGAQDILENGLLHGMGIIGEKFKNNEVFVPEVLVAARAMNMGVEMLKPLLQDAGVKARALEGGRDETDFHAVPSPSKCACAGGPALRPLPRCASSSRTRSAAPGSPAE